MPLAQRSRTHGIGCSEEAYEDEKEAAEGLPHLLEKLRKREGSAKTRRVHAVVDLFLIELEIISSGEG